jgi:hypothetical protein
MPDGEIVNIFNRCAKKVLSVTRNGVEKKLLPGDNHLPEGWVRFAKQQNPRMGTAEYGTFAAEYLVGVKADARLGQEQRDDISVIADGDEHVSIERINRETVPEEGRRKNAKPEKAFIPAQDAPRRAAPLGPGGGAHEGVAFRGGDKGSDGVAAVG